MATLWSNRNTTGMVPYKYEPTNIVALNKDILFAEHGSCPLHPIKRPLLIFVFIAMTAACLVTAPFVFEHGFEIAGLLLILAMMAISGTSVGLIILWVAWILRTTTLWPLYLYRHETGIHVQLIHRQPWCSLSDLSPSVATNTIDWIDGYGKPFKSKRLPDSVKSITHACWLQLEYQTRKRWVILSLHESEEDASKSILDWAQKLELAEDDAFCISEPPANAVFYYNPKLI